MAGSYGGRLGAVHWTSVQSTKTHTNTHHIAIIMMTIFSLSLPHWRQWRRQRQWRQFRFPYFSLSFSLRRYIFGLPSFGDDSDNACDALCSFFLSTLFSFSFFLCLSLALLIWWHGGRKESLHYTINNILQCSLMYLWISLSDARRSSKRHSSCVRRYTQTHRVCTRKHRSSYLRCFRTSYEHSWISAVVCC